MRFRDPTKKTRHYEMAVYMNGLIVIYRQIDYMRLWSYDNLIDRQVYASLLCWFFLTLSILCCSVPIVSFSGGF